MDDLLNDAGVDYWLDFGTLLRAVRDGHLDGDADLDLGMIYDKWGCEAAIAWLNRAGFEITRGYIGNDMTQFKAHRDGDVPVDFHVWRIKDNKAWTGAGYVKGFPGIARGAVQKIVRKWSRWGVTQYGGWPYKTVWWVVPSRHFTCRAGDKFHLLPISWEVDRLFKWPCWTFNYLESHYGPEWRLTIPQEHWDWRRDSYAIQEVPP